MSSEILSLVLTDETGKEHQLIGDISDLSLTADMQVRGLLKAIRYILDTPEGGSVLDSAVLASRRARDWMKRGGNNPIITMEQLVEAHSRCEATRYQIKEEMIGGLVRYKENRIPTGNFLRQVLENNLKEAVRGADAENQWAIPAIVNWCYNNLPAGAWGSPERVTDWLTEKEDTVL